MTGRLAGKVAIVTGAASSGPGVPLLTEGTAWDVAWAAVYLASDEARWVTGASIPIDGGQLAVGEFPT